MIRYITNLCEVHLKNITKHYPEERLKNKHTFIIESTSVVKMVHGNKQISVSRRPVKRWSGEITVYYIV